MSRSLANAWTSKQLVHGYRHFELVLQGGNGNQRWVELAAVINPRQRCRVSCDELRDRTQWVSGWQQIVELDEE